MSRIDDALNKSLDGFASSTATVAQPGARRRDATIDDYPPERGATPPPGRENTPVSTPASAPGRRPVDQARPTELSLIVHHEAPPAAIEQYRRLAATLHELQVQRGLKMLVVTSALPRDGKTLTVANLALTLSESYARRVLLIDADLRRPSLHQLFGLSDSGGLSRFLRLGTGEVSPARVSSRLSVLPAGDLARDPMAGLTSERMGALLDESAARYDWVLLDAPPVGVLPDAQVLARLTKAVVFVIGAGSTPCALVERAIAELGREYLVGAVLNRVDEKSILTTSYYRNYFGSAPRS
jgi:capsular exopolysaccharide synthesis family protein